MKSECKESEVKEFSLTYIVKQYDDDDNKKRRERERERSAHLTGWLLNEIEMIISAVLQHCSRLVDE